MTDVASCAMRETRNAILLERLEEERHIEVRQTAINQIVEDMAVDNITEVAEETFKSAQKEKKLEALGQIAKDLGNKIIEEIVEQALLEVAEISLLEYEREQQEKVRLLENSFKLKLVSRCFKSWRIFCVRAKKQKQAISDFPVTPSLLNPVEQNRKLTDSKSYQVASISKLRNERDEYDYLVKYLDLKESMLQSAILQPFDIIKMLQDSLKENIKGAVAMGLKLILSCEDLACSSEYFPAAQMIKRKFSRMFGEEESLPGLLVCRTVPFNRSALSLCVR